MTRGLIYYDEEYIEECEKFCNTRAISCLPHIGKSYLYHIYNRKNRTFSQPRKRAEDQVVQAEDFVFNLELKKVYAQNDIVFVYHRRLLTGVVHFSDFNRPMVSDYLFKRLSRLEKGLIKLILAFGSLEKNTLRPYKDQKIIPGDHSILEEQDFRGSNLSLSKILKYAFNMGILKIKEDHINKITAVRNKIAHSENLVERKRGAKFDYNKGSFHFLLNSVGAIEIAIKQVSNALYFTEIIHKKDPSIPVKPLEEVLFD